MIQNCWKEISQDVAQRMKCLDNGQRSKVEVTGLIVCAPLMRVRLVFWKFKLHIWSISSPSQPLWFCWQRAPGDYHRATTIWTHEGGKPQCHSCAEADNWEVVIPFFQFLFTAAGACFYILSFLANFKKSESCSLTSRDLHRNQKFIWLEKKKN